MSTLDRTLLRASWHCWISNDMRPRVGPYWLQWVWTLLFAAVLAVFFTVVGFLAYGSGEGAWRNIPGWIHWYGKNFIVCITIAAAIHLMFDLGRVSFATPARVAAWRPWMRSAYFAGTPLLGVLLFWPVGLWLAGQDVVVWFGLAEGRNAIAGTLLLSLLIGVVLHHWFASKAAEADAERRATEAQLRLLQAQIEPHFLFNTLANVHTLMDHDLPKARQMLADFTDYLRASLGTLRNDQSTVAHELDLARSYLQLLQGRMEDRLRFSVEADDAAVRLPLPPLLLQPLVENAVVHGLEPSIEGGRVEVAARLEGGRLVLTVRDDGRGLEAPPRPGARVGAGLALSNIRQRLRTRFGDAATLAVQPAAPGTLARITIPLDTSTP